MIRASIYGRAGRDPQTSQTKTEKLMCSLPLAVDIAREREEGTLWISVLAFGRLAEALQRHTQGDLIAAMGKLSRSSYTTGDGTIKESWTLVADSICSAKTVRPGGGKGKRKVADAKPGQRRPSKRLFDKVFSGDDDDDLRRQLDGHLTAQKTLKDEYDAAYDWSIVSSCDTL